MVNCKLKRILEVFDAELLMKCFFLWIFLYSSFIALVEISLCYILFSIIIYAVVLNSSLSPPNEKLVKKVLGENPRLKLRESIDVSLISNSELNRSFSIAHNAAVLDFNDNNAEAVKLCSQYGCQIIYLDVDVTKDGVLLVHRNSNFCIKNDSCDVTQLMEESVHKESVFDKKPNLSTLEEILPTVENLNVKIIFNVIHAAYKSSNSIANQLLKLYDKNPFLYGRAVICSTNPIILYAIRKSDPSVVVALKWTGISEQPSASISWLKKLRYGNSVKHFVLECIDSSSWWLLDHFFYRIIGLSAVIVPKEIITPKIVENWERKNVRCIVGVVNLSTEKFYYANALGVAFLTDTLLNVS